MKKILHVLFVLLLLVSFGCAATYSTWPNGAVQAENCIIREEIKIIDGSPTVTKRVIIPSKSIIEGSLEKVINGIKLLFGEVEK